MRPALFVPESKPVDDLLRGDAGRPHPHGDRRRRVRRHRRPGHHRGHPRGDRRRDHRRVRRGASSPVEELRGRHDRVTARLPIEDLGELFDVDARRRGRRDRRRPARQAAGPGADPGLARRGARAAADAEGTTGRRNRIDTVLVSRVEPEPAAPTADEGDMPERTEELDAEDLKLVTLARAARARIGAIEGAAVRDRTAAPTPPPPSPCRRCACPRSGCAWRWRSPPGRGDSRPRWC